MSLLSESQINDNLKKLNHWEFKNKAVSSRGHHVLTGKSNLLLIPFLYFSKPSIAIIAALSLH